ncbi:uncharacterized [Tachysurus ichikawai]
MNPRSEVYQLCLKRWMLVCHRTYCSEHRRSAKYSWTPEAHKDEKKFLISAFGFESADGSGGCAYQLDHTPTSTPPLCHTLETPLGGRDVGNTLVSSRSPAARWRPSSWRASYATIE